LAKVLKAWAHIANLLEGRLTLHRLPARRTLRLLPLLPLLHPTLVLSRCHTLVLVLVLLRSVLLGAAWCSAAWCASF
jgi:hypothetical protein